ncbi:hypothetical protein SALWKB12_0578 [Snodgrassella communis]|uniref:DUF2867 domain-containing protein n=1 Tax=Snodgrassella communis TaxID=2946699 RepID=UPI000460F90D|nr:DUF2867 domain-containing protein [Snodgrassella communis]KDN12771.1 hypothetical protein SALWKB12_0578 [Snodgrassella communis]
MINRQKTISKTLTELPDNVTLVAEKLDYLDCQRKEICKNITAYEAYKMMTSNQPEWLRMLFNLRDILVKPAGVRAIQGFTNLDEDKYKSGQINTAHFFTITEDTADKLTLIVKDSHLDVCVCVRITENTSNPGKNMLYLVASVRNHNFWGRLYMLPVSVLHPFIVHKLFENID